MAAPGGAVAAACSRCDRVFSSAGDKLAGSCSTCLDGDFLCQKCFDRHTTDARYVGHDFRALEEVYKGVGFLARMQLAPARRACLRHMQPLLNVRCAPCSATSSAASASNGLCAACVNEHAIAHPTHALTAFAPSAPALRAKLEELAALPVAFSIGPVTTASALTTSAAPFPHATIAMAAEAAAQTAPLVGIARRKALAAQGELDELAAVKEAALAQIEANYDAVISAAQACRRVNTEAVYAVAADKQTRLETELVAADAALGAAINATAALAEATVVLDDADIVQHAALLIERFTSARAAVAAIPEQPATSSFLAFEAAPGTETLRATVATLMGALSVTRNVQVEQPSPPPPSRPGPTDLSPEHAAWLQLILPPGGSPSPGTWEEVYRATTHGFGAAAFHARCDGRARLLVLVRAREGGWLFGGFTVVGFRSPGPYIADPAAFLFSLTNSLGRPEKLESKQTGQDLYYHTSISAIFGTGNDLCICNNADTAAKSYTNTGNSFASPDSMGAHPMARGRHRGWLAAEVVAWVV